MKELLEDSALGIFDRNGGRSKNDPASFVSLRLMSLEIRIIRLIIVQFHV